MRTTLNKVKALTPPLIWETARRVWYGALNLAQHLGPAVRIRQYCGLTLHFNRGSLILSRLKEEPIYEEEMCVAIERDLMKDGMSSVFLDVGANVGLVLAHVISKVPNVKIFAFEPGPEQRALLETTVKKNNLVEKVAVCPQGLGKEIGTVVFHTHDPRYVSNDGLIDTGRARGTRAIEVDITTLDSWWASRNSPKITVIKIDTEGAELWVLRGAEKVLAEVSPVIYLEIEPRNLRVYPYNHLDILAFLREHRYNLFTLNDVEITKENFSEYIGVEDTYVARPATII